MRSGKGFTLVEVLVALVLLAVALSAMIKTASENTVNTAYLRNKYLAGMVAMNKIDEMHASRAWPSTGKSNGKAELARQTWYWDMEIENTPDENLRKVELKISPEQDREKILYTLTGYIGQQ
jgi:general secretion pathway protein I